MKILSYLVLLCLLLLTDNINSVEGDSPFLKNRNCVLGSTSNTYGSIDSQYCKLLFKKPFYNFPIARNKDVVYFSLLGTSIPSNVDNATLDKLGPSFLEFATIHGGLGIWIRPICNLADQQDDDILIFAPFGQKTKQDRHEENLKLYNKADDDFIAYDDTLPTSTVLRCNAHSHKLTVEFRADIFNDTILPSNWRDYEDMNNTAFNNPLVWKNTGHIIVTFPEENNWLHSQTFATTTGYTYNKFVEDFLLNDEFIAKFKYYQPVSVVSPNNVTSFANGIIPILNLVPPFNAYSNSFTFIANLQHILVEEFSVPFTSFSNSYGSSITYTSANTFDLEIVPINSATSIKSFYYKLGSCLIKTWDDVNPLDNNGNAWIFLSQANLECFATIHFAYLYLNDTHIYKTTLQSGFHTNLPTMSLLKFKVLSYSYQYYHRQY